MGVGGGGVLVGTAVGLGTGCVGITAVAVGCWETLVAVSGVGVAGGRVVAVGSDAVVACVGVATESEVEPEQPAITAIKTSATANGSPVMRRCSDPRLGDITAMRHPEVPQSQHQTGLPLSWRSVAT